jgi:hypothetical protein
VNKKHIKPSEVLGAEILFAHTFMCSETNINPNTSIIQILTVVIYGAADIYMRLEFQMHCVISIYLILPVALST